ncbi:MAG: ABC transporter permease [Lachnospiraceae bacterium]|nr:ABC transporter permease [Lachnospiraceae bacterium]
MRNPLRKRLPRDLKTEFGKYLVIFLLLVLSIGFISGFLVAGESMIKAYDESFEKYNIEDGNFSSKKRLDDEQRNEIEALGIKLYDQFYFEQRLTTGSRLRIFKIRDEVNLVCLMQGALPVGENEIAVDRMFADNNHLTVGDTITVDGTGKVYTISGLVALSDYSTMFESNNDTMFDALTFGVAVVAKEAYDQYPVRGMSYNYAWKYDEKPVDAATEKVVSEELMKQMAKITKLERFVPGYINQAIHFTGDDLGSDRIMMIVLLYIIIIIIAFVFAITTSNTIAQEATVIGTLRASGYTKAELVRHYMAMPTIVTLAAAIVGNVLGYTWLKDVCVFMYYNSYSLPTYETVWSVSAFVQTTVIPLVITVIINYFLLNRALRLSPIRFLRKDLSRKKKKKAIPLSGKLPFFARFRLRVILQNVPNYLVLWIGILFADVLLLFGLGLPVLLNNYQDRIQDTMISDYQYLLNAPISATDENKKLESLVQAAMFMHEVETDNPDAEKFSAWTLKTLGDVAREESITLYGIEPGSQYVKDDLSDGKILISKLMADKYRIGAGDTFTMKEAYEDTTYTFTIDGVSEYEGSVAFFMSREKLNEIFDQEKDFFCGYFSNSPITDISEDYLSTVVDLNAMTKVTRQLQHSMGSMMDMVNVFAVIIFLILMYLLSKIIIEKNAQSISMTKILGYRGGEIRGLYLHSTSIMVVISLLVSIPLVKVVLMELFYVMMLEMISGWLPLTIPNWLYVEAFVMGLLSYALVALIEMRRIKKIPMDLALKNVE